MNPIRSSTLRSIVHFERASKAGCQLSVGPAHEFDFEITPTWATTRDIVEPARRNSRWCRTLIYRRAAKAATFVAANATVVVPILKLSPVCGQGWYAPLLVDAIMYVKYDNVGGSWHDRRRTSKADITVRNQEMASSSTLAGQPFIVMRAVSSRRSIHF